MTAAKAVARPSGPGKRLDETAAGPRAALLARADPVARYEELSSSLRPCLDDMHPGDERRSAKPSAHATTGSRRRRRRAPRRGPDDLEDTVRPGISKIFAMLRRCRLGRGRPGASRSHPHAHRASSIENSSRRSTTTSWALASRPACCCLNSVRCRVDSPVARDEGRVAD